MNVRRPSSRAEHRALDDPASERARRTSTALPGHHEPPTTTSTSAATSAKGRTSSRSVPSKAASSAAYKRGVFGIAHPLLREANPRRPARRVRPTSAPLAAARHRHPSLRRLQRSANVPLGRDRTHRRQSRRCAHFVTARRARATPPAPLTCRRPTRRQPSILPTSHRDDRRTRTGTSAGTSVSLPRSVAGSQPSGTRPAGGATSTTRRRHRDRSDSRRPWPPCPPAGTETRPERHGPPQSPTARPGEHARRRRGRGASRARGGRRSDRSSPADPAGCDARQSVRRPSREGVRLVCVGRAIGLVEQLADTNQQLRFSTHGHDADFLTPGPTVTNGLSCVIVHASWRETLALRLAFPTMSP